ncbi:MAG: DUF1858 domain-containing protein [candidate division Zixibacteria bacterium HGW-Zixibacteria-1]|nr:MAG: DUF1858 domain-containing protein [candidate division Zixibacteria bacterium HGW-Zixibacteria-1]
MIQASDTVEDLLKIYPEIDAYLIRRGIRCVVCGEPVWSTIGELIENKGLDVDEMISELNDKFAGDQK